MSDSLEPSKEWAVPQEATRESTFKIEPVAAPEFDAEKGEMMVTRAGTHPGSIGRQGTIESRRPHIRAFAHSTQESASWTLRVKGQPGVDNVQIWRIPLGICLPIVDAFRTLVACPLPAIRVVFQQIQQLAVS